MKKPALSTSLSSGATFAVLAILFITLVMINSAVFRSVRLDLTENNLYTLSEGTLNILSGLTQPLHLYLFFSEQASRDYPQIRNYHIRVKEMLEEYRLHSNGMLKVSYVDPEPFSEDEDRAAQLGVQAVTLDDKSLYFGLAGTNVLDDTEAIAFFQPDREVFLEYELGQLIYGLAKLKKPVLGIMTRLDMHPDRVDPQTGQMERAWVIVGQLEKLFDVRKVSADTNKIGNDIDVLMVVHPKNLGDKTLYAIDQFVMRGGRGLFFVDPVANSDITDLPQDQPLQDAHARSSSLNRLFKSWGFSVNEDSVIGDGSRALRASLSTGATVRHLTMIGMKPQDFDIGDAAMSGLQSVNFAMASYIEDEDDATITIEPLITSSSNAMPFAIDLFRFSPNPDLLQQKFTATKEKYTLAARVRGNLESAFARAPQDDDGDVTEATASASGEHLASTQDQAELVVVADTDLLTDTMWVRVQSFFGQNIVRPLASNGDFVGNVVESLFGDSNLINIRSRASYSRPFTKVEEIETEAEQKYREAAEKLQQELNQINNRLRELEKEKTDKQSALLSRKQQQELNNARKKRIEVRKQLRNVRHQQNKDIENLGTTLKVINIGLVPLLVTLAAGVLGFLRLRNRRREV